MSNIDWCQKLNWGEDQIEDLRLAGYSYIRQGKYDIALSFFEALVILDNKSAYDARTLGGLYLQQNEPLIAINWFEKALKLEKNHGPTLINLCKALFTLGKKEEGIKLATILKKETNPMISNTATALLMAYS